MGQRNFCSALAFFHNGRIGGKPSPAGEINRQADQHAYACSTESVMPAVDFAKCAGDQRGGDYSSIDKYVVNLKRVRTPVVAGCIERADLLARFPLKQPTPVSRQVSAARKVTSNAIRKW